MKKKQYYIYDVLNALFIETCELILCSSRNNVVIQPEKVVRVVFGL